MRFTLLALALYTLGAVIMTYPLALRAGDALLGTDVNALNDSYLSVWIFAWQAHQLVREPLQLFHGNVFYPFPNTLAFSEIILPEALLYLPLELATGNPILAYNLVVLALFPLNGLAMYWFALDTLRLNGETVTERQHGAALLAGVIYSFCTYKLGELRHVQLLAAQFIPLTLLYLARLARAPNARNAVLTALLFALNALSSLYYAVFAALAMALYVVVDFAVRRYRLTRAHLLYAALAGALALAILLPFALPFLQVEREMRFSASRDPNLFSARPASYLAAAKGSWLYGDLTRGLYVASKGQPLFPGVVALALAVIGLVTYRRRAVVYSFLLALTAFVLSFGPRLLLGRDIVPALAAPLPYYWLSLVVTPLQNLNAPARFAVLVMLALALLAAYGAQWLGARFRPRAGLLLITLGALVLLEAAALPLPLAPVAAGKAVAPVYVYLAQQSPAQPVVETPMGAPTFADQDRYVVYMYNSIYHWQPLVNGHSSFLPPAYLALVKAMQKFPSLATVKRLKEWGAVFVIVHAERIKNAEAWRKKLETLDGLAHVGDFGNDWLYRIE